MKHTFFRAGMQDLALDAAATGRDLSGVYKETAQRLVDYRS